MKIISFAWTTAALLAGRKTVTRRFWDDEYASTFKAGELVAAYDKNPRAGGKQIATIRLTRDPYMQSLHDVTDEDERREGGLWGCGKAFTSAMLGEGRGSIVWVIEFELLTKDEAEGALFPKR